LWSSWHSSWLGSILAQALLVAGTDTAAMGLPRSPRGSCASTFVAAGANPTVIQTITEHADTPPSKFRLWVPAAALRDE
jgi:hypothetical protein